MAMVGDRLSETDRHPDSAWPDRVWAVGSGLGAEMGCPLQVRSKKGWGSCFLMRGSGPLWDEGWAQSGDGL